MHPSEGASKRGQWAAKLLGIDPNERYHNVPHQALHATAQSTPEDVDMFMEGEPTIGEWFREIIPTFGGLKRYIISIFPFTQWILNYNTTWLLGDLVSGITVGFVAVPQGMAYALLAKLPPEYGLYTSFVGFLCYWMFATSKDITIGTVAVMSQLTGEVITRVQSTNPEFDGPTIARVLSLMSGSVLLFIGLARLGWLVELIPLVAISSFMTGAAINIAAGQVPALLGIKGINTRAPTYQVIINTLKNLPHAGIDAAFGISSLVILYGVRSFCNYMSRRQPRRQKLWFFVSTLRLAGVVLIYILISFLLNRHIGSNASKSKFRILGTVPRGFKVRGAPHVSATLAGELVKDLPATVIVLVIEHIAISKSFGRINNYVINPSQELVAVGVTNVLGPFLGAYPGTGSFSRTAIKSKAGVRTPLAGLSTAAITLLALYALTGVFFYIPLAMLSAVITHAVIDLIVPPKVVYNFWQLSPLEVPIFFGGVFITIFTNIENGIYFTVASSAAILLVRLARTPGHFLGRVKVHRALVDSQGHSKELPTCSCISTTRDAYITLDHSDGTNPQIQVKSPHPGVFVYRFSVGLNYTNQGYYMEKLVEHIFASTRRTELKTYASLGDRPWNDPGPRRGTKEDDSISRRPILKAIILDFSTVSNLDVTSVQGLLDVRNQLERYAAPSIVQWHFASVNNRWARRALSVAGFGFPSVDQLEHLGRWKPIFSVAPTDASDVYDGLDYLDKQHTRKTLDEESGHVDGSGGASTASSNSAIKEKKRLQEEEITGDKSVAELCKGESGRYAAIHGMNRPFFHIDVQSAVESTLLNIRHERGPDAHGGTSDEEQR